MEWGRIVRWIVHTLVFLITPKNLHPSLKQTSPPILRYSHSTYIHSSHSFRLSPLLSFFPLYPLTFLLFFLPPFPPSSPPPFLPSYLPPFFPSFLLTFLPFFLSLFLPFFLLTFLPFSLLSFLPSNLFAFLPFFLYFLFAFFPCVYSPAVFEGHPFIVEAGVSLGGKQVKAVRTLKLSILQQLRKKTTQFWCCGCAFISLTYHVISCHIILQFPSQ